MLFYRTENDKLIDYGEFEYVEGCQKTTIISMAELEQEPNKVIVKNGKLILNPNYEQEKQAQEQERVNNLTMTPLDFIKVLQSFGLSLQKINEFLESNLEIKMQLTYCSNVYCGVVKSFLPMTIDEITITPEMAEQAFKLKNGEVITND